MPICSYLVITLPMGILVIFKATTYNNAILKKNWWKSILKQDSFAIR